MIPSETDSEAQHLFALKPSVKAVRDCDGEKVHQALLDTKADPDKPDFTGHSPLAYARQSGRPAIEALLRTAGGRE